MGKFHELKQQARKANYKLKHSRKGNILLTSSDETDVHKLKSISETEKVIQRLKGKK